MLESKNIIHPDFVKNNIDLQDATTLNPIPFEVAPYQSELLPSPLSEWVQDVSIRANMPADYMAASIIVGTSILICHKTKVHPKQNDDWEVTPNLWGLIIGEPSAGKSPMLKQGLSPINKLDENQLNSPNNKRIFAYDATIEKMGKILSSQDNGILLTRDELNGLFQSLTKKGYENARSFYLESFNGDSEYIFDRVSHDSIRIKNLCISILGGLQPSVLSSLVSPAISGTRNDGLIQRFQIAVWPNKLTNKYVDEKPNKAAKEKVECLFSDLWDYVQSAEKKSLRFSLEAQQLFEQFAMLHDTQTNTDMNPVLEEHFGKYPSLLASLALIFQIIENVNSEIISTTSFKYALKWVEYLASHARKIYGFHQHKRYENANKISQKRTQLMPNFCRRDIEQKSWGGLANKPDIEDAIEILLNHNLIKTVKVATHKTGRKPLMRYEWAE
jgi:putative DNA primase/helicase